MATSTHARNVGNRIADSSSGCWSTNCLAIMTPKRPKRRHRIALAPPQRAVIRADWRWRSLDGFRRREAGESKRCGSAPGPSTRPSCASARRSTSTPCSLRSSRAPAGSPGPATASSPPSTTRGRARGLRVLRLHARETAGALHLARQRPLDEIERMRTEFLGLVSHELRAPLTSIKGSADTLLEERADSRPGRDARVSSASSPSRPATCAG